MPTKLAKREIIVLKPRYDQTVIRILAQRLKSHVFPRKHFRKPKNLDIELITLEKQYEHYLIIKGKYSIDHCKSLIYELEVEKDTNEVFLFNETLKPEPYSATNPDEYHTIELTGVAGFHYENEACYISDNRGQEIDSKELDYILNEKWHKEKLTKSELRKILSKLKITPEEEINLLKNKLIKKPKNAGEVIKEILEISERKIIYLPVYQLNFINKKTKNQAILKINGITGKIVLTTNSNKVFPIKIIEEANRESHKITKLISQKPIEESQVNKSSKTARTIKPKLKKEIRKTKSSVKNSKDSKPTQIISEPPPKLGKPETKIETAELEFPAKVAGDIFYVGNKLTAIVGDIEIPPGTIVNDNLVVKGNLTIGEKCRLHATIKALGNIVIGADTIVKGNVISDQKVSLGPRVNIQGEVIIKKTLSSQSQTS